MTWEDGEENAERHGPADGNLIDLTNKGNHDSTRIQPGWNPNRRDGNTSLMNEIHRPEETLQTQNHRTVTKHDLADEEQEAKLQKTNKLSRTEELKLKN